MGDEISRDGANLCRDYLRAQERLRQANDELVRAKDDAREAEQRFGSWILPPDAAAGEQIAVWQGDSLFVANKNSEGAAYVRVRTRGKHFADLGGR